MIYLDVSDYETYGLEASTPQVCVATASALMDAHCRRPTLAIDTYTERLRLDHGRTTVRLSFLPLAPAAPATSPLISARARYGPPRRGEGDLGDFSAGIAQAFSLPGSWTALDASAIEYCPVSGELTLAMNPLGLGFNEVEIEYTAGLDPIPDALKYACALIVRNSLATPALNVRAGTLDRMHMEYFADSLLDHDVRALLAPYVAHRP